LECKVGKIENDTLFKEKNRVENRLKSIEEFNKLQLAKSQCSQTLDELEQKLERQKKAIEKNSDKKEELVKEIEKLEALQLSALAIANYEESRKSLKEGEECPLCGSREHPFLINMPKFDDAISIDLSDAKSNLKTLDLEIKRDEQTINKTITTLEVTKSSLKTIEESLDNLDVSEKNNRNILEEELKKLELEIQNNSTVEEGYTKSLKEFEKFKLQEQESKDKRVKLLHEIELLENNILNYTKESNSLQLEIERLKKEEKKSESEILEIKASVIKLLDAKTVEEVKKELESEATKLNKEKDTLQIAIDAINKKLTINQTTTQTIEKNIVEFKQKLTILKSKIEELLQAQNFKDRDAVISAYIKDEEEIKELQRKKKYFEDKTIEIDALFKSTKERLEIECNRGLQSTKSIEELSQNEKELTQKRDEINKNATVIEEELKQNENIKNEQAVIFKEIDAQKNLLLPWEILNKLIGSATGASYQKFVQNLTLGHLLILANKHIRVLSDRYSLVKTDNEKLDISILDGYYLDSKRGVNTLSGGERFLVSLSLALGLSDLVNDKIKVDSLFLDEGFGTLDEESLNMAIVALEKLHAKGKLIGIISHVELLKDRIYAQVQLKKKSDGSSDIVIVS